MVFAVKAFLGRPGDVLVGDINMEVVVKIIRED